MRFGFGCRHVDATRSLGLRVQGLREYQINRTMAECSWSEQKHHESTDQEPAPDKPRDSNAPELRNLTTAPHDRVPVIIVRVISESRISESLGTPKATCTPGPWTSYMRT